ncbi:MAG TPA: class I SAM-dependent methyltransferase [Gemmatimonadaceae bacterium]|jgi:SAM-dependent methyltransferase
MCAHVADSPSAALLASYDAVPYGGGAIAGTRPDYLAAVARFRGLSTPDVRRCRVLDVGCATGGNLLSMALAFPESNFVGIDLSPRQIESARAAARTIGLENVRFEAMSVMDVDEDFGTFEYIVSHGVYSWVPPDVQHAILSVCSRNLVPDGIAYVSYNTYPGWHARGLVREMMLFHDRPQLSPSERVQRARDLLESVAKAVPKSDEVYAAVLQEEIHTLSDASESYFMHEELESENHPVYFIDFARRAAAVGLQYVTEATASLTDTQLSPELRAKLRSWSTDNLQYEQYFDYVRNRTFRRSVLCHAGRGVESEPVPTWVPEMVTRARCYVDAEAPEAKQPGVEVFRTHEGVAATMAHPLARAALHSLIDARPSGLSFEALAARTQERMEGGDGFSRETLADAMLRCALVRLVDLTMAPTPCCSTLSLQPVASPLARLESRNESLVTSLLHVAVELSPFDRFVLQQLNGTRDHGKVVDEVMAAIARRELDLGPAERGAVALAVDHAFQQFRLSGLLIA